MGDSSKGERLPLQVSPPATGQDSNQEEEDPATTERQVAIRLQHQHPLHHHHRHHHHQHQHSPHNIIASVLTPSHHQFISTPLYIPTGSPHHQQQQFEPVVQLGTTVKRPRFSPTGQWKPVPSPSHSHSHSQSQLVVTSSDQSSPSPTSYNPQPPQPPPLLPPQVQLDRSIAPAASSSDTASSPSHSPTRSSLPTPPPTQDPVGRSTSSSKAPDQGEDPLGHPQTSAAPTQQQQHHQFRKGKYVSPVWKPHEMLWLARAWRAQYQGVLGPGAAHVDPSDTGGVGSGTGSGRGKTRAEKDKEVAEFLKKHGVNRDAKTAGTKWDNMLGEFRKVYEWERGGEREQLMFGKSYFRLSPYERKIHRLPASFDEEVFEELAQFMGSRMRSSSSTTLSSSSTVGDDHSRLLTPSSLRALALPPPPPPSCIDQDINTSLLGKTRQIIMTSGIDPHHHHHPLNLTYDGMRRNSTLLGLDIQQYSSPGLTPLLPSSSLSSSRDQLRRIGRIRMTWEESVSLWVDQDGEHHRGRVKVQDLSFLNADELFYLDESMVACTMEAFEDGPLKGFSVDRFISDHQVKVFGRRKSSSASPLKLGSTERIQFPATDPRPRYISTPEEVSDPTGYYLGCLRVPPPTLPTLVELSWHIQEPPPPDLRFPLDKNIYRDLPQEKELFFTTSSNGLLDSRSFAIEILSSILRQNPSLTTFTATSRDSFIPLWDDCINRIISKFCPVDLTLVRKPTTTTTTTMMSSSLLLQDQWPNVTGFVNNLCLWRGEETDRARDHQGHGRFDPCYSISRKLLWTYFDLPYILGYYAVGPRVTFCALSRSTLSSSQHERENYEEIVRTDLLTVDLSSQSERIKAIVPCWRISCLLPLLADSFLGSINGKAKPANRGTVNSDFLRVDLGNGRAIEMTPNTVTRFYPSHMEWAGVKEIYGILDRRVPHSEYISSFSEDDLSISFRPRGLKVKPENCEELIEALKHVTKALVALHDLSFVHRDLSWDKVVRRWNIFGRGRGGSEGDGDMEEDEEEEEKEEWVLCGFEEAVATPQINSNPNPPDLRGSAGATGSEPLTGRRAPEMGRVGGVYGVKVDVWGVGYLVKTCGLGSALPKKLKELEKRCLLESPEQRPTAADCYHHLLQFQSSAAAASGGRADGY